MCLHPFISWLLNPCLCPLVLPFFIFFRETSWLKWSRLTLMYFATPYNTPLPWASITERLYCCHKFFAWFTSVVYCPSLGVVLNLFLAAPSKEYFALWMHFSMKAHREMHTNPLLGTQSLPLNHFHNLLTLLLFSFAKIWTLPLTQHNNLCCPITAGEVERRNC